MKVLVFDTECTSLLSKTGDNDNFHILQLSYIVYDTVTKVSEETDFILKSPVKILNSDIHGITNERVVTEPTFNELAVQVSDMIKGCDLAGFNSNRFDIPLLAEEMLRADLDFDMKNRYVQKWKKAVFLPYSVT